MLLLAVVYDVIAYHTNPYKLRAMRSISHHDHTKGTCVCISEYRAMGIVATRSPKERAKCIAILCSISLKLSAVGGNYRSINLA